MLENGAIFMILKRSVMTDELCPMRHTISKHELRMRGKVLVKHLKRQAIHRRERHPSSKQLLRGSKIKLTVERSRKGQQ